MSHRHVLMTGVSAGIGLELARQCLSSGWTVHAMNRRSPAELAGLGDLRFVSCDLSDTASIPGRLRELLAGVDRLDLAVLNAGSFDGLSLMKDTSEEDLERTMRVNVWANKAILDHLASSHAELRQVVALSSSAAVKARRGWSGYSISKAALNMMIRLYGLETPRTHFTALSPGLVDTGLFDRFARQAGDERFPDLAAYVAMRGTSNVRGPGEVAAKILRLLPRLLEGESGAYVELRDLPEAA